ncbi:hypothetical protein Ato02nite_031020 [Paractinoplanes toevensis]|uniref:Uncharacterized protein n=1 Tax=Paractinoplanes toevensis TaxID=571911 RepID=A0A919W280_9ACTN|nr:hypothetical protein Ato02nite_031020 [Actinoplanes toevensis]
MLTLVALYVSAEVRRAFDDWHDRFEKLAFAEDRLLRSSGPGAARVASTGPRHARVCETDARDRTNITGATVYAGPGDPPPAIESFRRRWDHARVGRSSLGSASCLPVFPSPAGGRRRRR